MHAYFYALHRSLGLFIPLIVVNCMIGLITPPVGMNVFILRSIVPQVPIGAIFRGTGWFFVTEVVVLALLIAFPAISLALPELM